MPSDWRTFITGASAREVADSIGAAVRRGDMRPGESIPSIRALAETLSLSPATVASALGLLRQRGIVETSERRATRIVNIPPSVLPERVRDLRHGGPDGQLLPDLRPALRRAAKELTGPRLYGLPPIDPELKSIGAARFAADGIDAEELVAVGGSLDGVQRALEALLSRGDRVAVEDPGYADHFELVRSLGMTLVGVRVDDAGPIPEAFEAALAGGVRAAILTPIGQNPRGSMVSLERARELNELIRRNAPETLIIEDQHLSFVTDRSQTVTHGLRRWIVVRSLAKSLGPDLRLALVAGDQSTVRSVAERLAVGPGWISHLLQRTAVHLLNDRTVTDLLRRAGDVYTGRRRALLQALAAGGVEAYGPTGLNVWVPVEDEAAVAVRLAEAGWAVAPGRPFRIDSGPAIRVTSSTLPEIDAPGVAAAVGQAIERRIARRG